MAKMTDNDDAFDAASTARELVRCGRRAALATLDRDSGAPYASLVSVATAGDGGPLLLLSNLARHTHNITADARVSLLVEQVGEGDPLAAPRVTVTGTIAPEDDADARRRFLARQPLARGYAGFADFRIWRLEPDGAHLVAGFGRIHTLPREAVMTPVGDATALLESEEGAVAHMNSDHGDAVRLYAENLLGAPAGVAWQMEGFDPEGCELSGGGRVLYLRFSERLTGGGDLRRALVQMAADARLTGKKTAM